MKKYLITLLALIITVSTVEASAPQKCVRTLNQSLKPLGMSFQDLRIQSNVTKFKNRYFNTPTWETFVRACGPSVSAACGKCRCQFHNACTWECKCCWKGQCRG